MDRHRRFLLPFIGILLGLSEASNAQNLEFVQSDYIKIPNITTDAQINTLTPTQKTTTILYYDGLGRPLQNITEQASPLLHDIIQPVAYNNIGAQTINYLPYADESANPTGSYRANAIATDQPAFYNNTSQHLVAIDAAPYSQQVFENSPLQRLLQAGMVGTGFQPNVSGNYAKSFNYRPNSTSVDGNILQWNPDGTYTTGTYYGNNTLSVTDGKDEDNVETLSFSDLEGHIVLRRQILASGNLDTYYIYNNAGLINYVIPPLALATMVANGSYNISATNVIVLVFKYTYNSLGQVTTKTIPGKGTINFVYDPLNRPVLIQDANMATNYNWNYLKYDAKGRIISQGIYNDAAHRSFAVMQTYVSGLPYTVWYETRTSTLTNGGYYSNNVFPTGTAPVITPLSYAYFDDYYMTGNAPTADFSFVATGMPNEETPTSAAVKGMPTAVSKTTVGSGLSNVWLTTAIFYDKRGNIIQSQSNNQLNYTNVTTVPDIKTNVPDFTGVTQVAYVKHVIGTGAGATSTAVQTNFTYDQMNRVSAISQQYNGSSTATVVAAYSYNEIGQVIQKNLGQVATSAIPSTLNLSSTYSGTNTAIASNSITLSPNFNVPSGSTFHAFISTGYLQTVDLRYNIRGQLLTINNSTLSNDGGVTNNDNTDLFGMQFLYDKVDGNLNNTPSYDGKLTGVKWMSTNTNGSTTYERAYNYYYDQLNRDAGAVYAERPPASTGTTSFTVTHGWDENGITYDQNGNILTMLRMDATQGSGTHTPIDNLTYTYDTANNPNQLMQISDATGDPAGFNNITGAGGSSKYFYDANGNLIADPYKGIALQYNVLNRTDKITINAGTNQNINYTYDAGGNLIRKQAYNNGAVQTTDYIDGFVYLSSGTGAAALSYFPMPEGRVINNAGTLVQEFVITDAQGNARLSFQNNGNGVPVVKQENSYYPFGLIMPNGPVATPVLPNKQLYNGGSEWQNDYSNLPDYYQTYYRNYDAALARFVGVDPGAEGAEGMSTYQYAANNPIMLNDPLGNLPPGRKPPQRLPLSNFDDLIPPFDNVSEGLYGSDPDWANVLAMVYGTTIYNANDPNSLMSFNQMAGWLFNQGVSLSLTQSDINAMLAPYRGQEVWFNSDGLLVGANHLQPGDANAIVAHQWDNGNQQTTIDKDYTLLVLIAKQPVAVPDEGQSFGDVMAALWNSPLARSIVPDEVSLNVNLNYVMVFGMGVHVQATFMTRGKDAGSLHVSGGYTMRVGCDMGVSATLGKGNYLGDPSDASFNQLMGPGVDLSGGYEIYSGGIFSSLNNNYQPTWVGYTQGFGAGAFPVSGSAGFGPTVPLF